MELQTKKQKKRTLLVRGFYHLSLTWQIVLTLLALFGVSVVVWQIAEGVGVLYVKIVSDKYYVSKYLGDEYEVRSYFKGSCRIVKCGKHRALVKGVESVEGNEGDSLWVVNKDGLYAFFNSNTGHMMTPFVYEKAWAYSEGVAAVVDTNDRLRFIATDGSQLFDMDFVYDNENECDYIVHGGMCPVYDTMGRVGLINMTGTWAIDPCYDSVDYVSKYWVLKRNDSLMVVDTGCRIVISMIPGHALNITEEGDLAVWHKKLPGRLYGSEGNLLSRQTYWRVDSMMNEDDGEVVSDVLVYSTDYLHYGLLSLDGQILTEALYEDIDAIGKNVFRAKYRYESDEYDLFDDAIGSTSYVLLNNKGELLEK